MKKIIGNKVYDTDKATLMDCIFAGTKEDLLSYNVCLYRTESGEFFIYSKSRSGSEDIVPCDCKNNSPLLGAGI